MFHHVCCEVYPLQIGTQTAIIFMRLKLELRSNIDPEYTE